MKIKIAKFLKPGFWSVLQKFVPIKITNHTVVGNALNINCTADHRERASKNQIVYHIVGNFIVQALHGLLY